MLTAEQIGQYHENGYVIPDYRLPESDLADIRSHHERLVARHPEFRNYCPTLLAYDLAFLNYARNPDILDMVEQVLGPNIALWNSSFFAKPARDGYETPWHQDGEYWPLRPMATCTVWIAVDAASSENGCLQVIRGSHKARRLRSHHTNADPELTLHQEIDDDEIDLSEAVGLELEAGQISLHDVYLTHGSLANRSERPRRGMTLRYMPTSTVFDRDFARRLTKEKGVSDHTNRTVFLVRGIDESGENDFRLRL
jgi:ectoine hydroxylase-related dioxygenase (phytanoyl-CoA dioxygenase family)